MKITPATPANPDAIANAAFLRRHYPGCRHWPRAVLVAWVDWHMGQGFLARVVHEGCIVGVGVARPVMKPEDAVADDYAFDPEGAYLFLDALATTHKDAWACLFHSMRTRFGVRPHIAYQRRGESKIRVQDFMRMHARVFAAATA